MTYEEAIHDYDNQMQRLYRMYDGPIPDWEMPRKPRPEDFLSPVNQDSMKTLDPLMDHLDGIGRLAANKQP